MSTSPEATESDRILRSAVEHAVLAPSGHNTQPWLFHIEDDTIELFADRRRALPVVDPDDRELIISCGAALSQLELTLLVEGRRAEITLLPSNSQPDLLASIRLAGRHEATADERNLFYAIPNRRTNRLPFEDRHVPADTVATLIRDVESERAWIHTTQATHEKESLADLICEGDRRQAADKSFRRELAQWVHANRSVSQDGMPGYAHGVGDLASHFGSFVIRTFDWGDGQAAKDRQLAEGSPLMIVIGTDSDAATDWLQCGRALARLLLRLTSRGLAASYLNQPIEHDELRPRLLEMLGRDGFPQLLLRVGYGKPVRATPRRAVGEVLI